MKKQNQLGMNPSTASGRLVKDILYSLVVKTEQNACYHCGDQMTRETFSVEHKEAWLDTDDPVRMFFDLNNISFSHLKCNVGAARKPAAPCGSTSAYRRGCRCSLCSEANLAQNIARYTPEARRRRYLAKGH